jgi:hypothetical protein
MLDKEIIMRTVYGIHGDETIIFIDLIAAEKYLYENYQEYMGSKDQCMEFCENMIWEDIIKTCEGCGEKIIYSDIDEHWINPSCCDVWFCNRDCHS